MIAKDTGSRSPPVHGAARTLSPDDSQVDVRLKEPGVRVLFHEAEDFTLCHIEAGHRGSTYVLLDGHLRRMVYVYLQDGVERNVRDLLCTKKLNV